MRACDECVKQNEQSRDGFHARLNCLTLDRDSIEYQCDNLGDVTRSVTPPMTDNSCGCSEQSHYSLRLVIRLNIFDCYGRGDFGTSFLLPPPVNAPAGTQTRACGPIAVDVGEGAEQSEQN